MERSLPLFRPSPLHVTGLKIAPEGITLVAQPTGACGICPACGVRSNRIHSRYRRTLQDLPAHGRRIALELDLRRFFCDLPDCAQQTFGEQLPDVAQRHARKTLRLMHALQDIAFTAGGEAGSRLADKLAMPASADTLLRLLRWLLSPTLENGPRVLGVDDWAIRRGQVYGTILCDLEKRRPVDLLPERSAEALAVWLGKHPGTQIISRDRGGDYAKGAAIGAPHAVQVADRWHLLHNLTDSLQKAVDSRQSLLDEVTKEVTAALTPIPSTPAPPAARSPTDAPPMPLSRADQKKEQSRQRRLARWEQVRKMAAEGISLRQISRTLKIGRETVERFSRCGQFPERATPAPRIVPLDRFIPCLRQRWEEGCDNVTELWQDICGQGFNGSVFMVRRQVRRWRRAAGIIPMRGPRPIASPRIIRPSGRRVAWLALGHVREPTPQDVWILKAIFARWPQLRETAELARMFSGLLKEHAADSLEAWVQLAEGPMILPEVRRFAQVLRRDWAAVLEAVRGPWSQGQVEGQVNRLKLIRRQMYGRANFDLLRQRVLHATA